MSAGKRRKITVVGAGHTGATAALFLAPSTDERPAIAQPVLASVLAVLSVFTVVTGLYNRPLEDWSNQGPASLGIPADGQGR